MKLELSRFDRFHLPRIAQLMQRSNQFNLTTRRLTEIECEALMRDAAFLPLFATLKDRFGDHGLIGIVVLERNGEVLSIRDWLMSCRVLARGVEQSMMNYIIDYGAKSSVKRIVGQYKSTAKNDMVREFYQQFGFTRVSADGSQWAMDVAAYQPIETFIQLELPAMTI
jgi:FkbH-like protein